MKPNQLLGIIGLVNIILLGCSPKTTAISSNLNEFVSETGIPDYSQLNYWASHPEKRDPADSIPKPLMGSDLEKVADVFYLHPTTLTDADKVDQINARIDDTELNNKTDLSPILYQASVFNERARIFAPRYRQAHIRMYFEKDSAKQYAAFNLAYEDIRNAFKYYLEHYNNGRPIIIASHSQGTTHSTRLLKEFFDGKPLEKQLVCGYLIGMGVKKDQYEKIPVCSDSLQTGCFVSWRTYRNDFVDSVINRNDSGIAVVNPITWTTNNEIVGREKQKGAILYNFKKVIDNTQGAQAEGNALWVSHPRFPGSFLYTKKNYHAGDINLFYIDIRENVSKRIDAFLSKNK
jgi:hypothetical protein